VLHLLAIAHAAKVKLTIDDFTRIGKRVPVLADLKPSGKHLMSELVAIGGIRPLMRILLDKKLLHGDALDRHRRDDCRDVARCETVSGAPDNHSAVRPADQKGQPSRHLSRQPCARRRGRENFRQGRIAIHRTRARLQFRGRPRWPRSSTARL
jgi:dihydroxy-acid dehydratase